jgi:hypothetical protein
MNALDLSRLDGSAAPAEAGSLIPLARAVEVIAAEIYGNGRSPSLVSRDELCDALACTLSALSPMFVLDSQPLRQLSEEEIGNARFRNGGTEMYFCDGRPPMREIAVTADGMAKVIGVLKDSPPKR